MTFAPKTVVLEASESLIVGGGSIGFDLHKERGGTSRRLNWDVSARLFRVDSSGAARAKAGSGRWRIARLGSLEAEELRLPVGGRPASYRMDVFFRRVGSKRLLGHFSQYFRVVRPWFGGRLVASRPAVGRGQEIAARLANYGTETLFSSTPDWSIRVERFDGQAWVRAASDPPPEKQKPIIKALPAGQMGECTRARIQADEVPGRFRFAVTVVRRGSDRSADRRLLLTTEFHVAKHALR